MNQIAETIFALCCDVRYVALYRDGNLATSERAGISVASASDSDRYEELFVNPVLLTLIRQRGNLDCGGAKYLIVRYGNFYQLVLQLPDGHVSVAFELSSSPIAYAEEIFRLCIKS